jgi:uncharacterized protein YjbI with pentapeptide repeats
MAEKTQHLGSDTMFIPPGENFTDGESLKAFATLPRETLISRWNTGAGRDILRRWEGAGFSRASLDEQVGRYHGHTDLRGAPLSGKTLEGLDLSAIDFFAADLSRSSLSKSNLQDSWLSHADFRGTRFDFCKLDNALVDDVKFDKATSFLGVNLNAINFNLAAHLQALALRQQWISDLQRHHKTAAWLLWITCDYGRSFSRFALWLLGINLLFALVYYLTQGTSAVTLLENVYFAFVTFTTLGYGDFSPTGPLGMAVVIVHVLFGYLMLGLLVAILSKRLLGW